MYAAYNMMNKLTKCDYLIFLSLKQGAYYCTMYGVLQVILPSPNYHTPRVNNFYDKLFNSIVCWHLSVLC